MIVEGSFGSAGGQVIPNRDSELLFHSFILLKSYRYANIPTMRLGIDYRGAQVSGLRGIGRYTTDLVSGILAFAPEIDVTLFVKPNGVVPAELSQCRIVPIEAMSWTDPTRAIWTKIPKIRSLNFLHARHCKRSVAEQKRVMEKALRNNPVDILHIPSALDIGSYPIFDYPCPVVMTFLDAIVLRRKENTFNRFRPFAQAYYMEQAENLTMATRIVAISHASATDATDVFGIPTEKIDVVYPSVSQEFAVPRPMPERVLGKPYFLFCSAPDPNKNPDVVIEAFARMPSEFQLIFVSPKDSEFLVGLRNRVQELGFADRFMVTGFVPEEELYGLFQHATALVSPSQMEGFGLPVAQAMRAGTPVVTSKFSAQAEIAEGVGYLVDPNSVDEVAAAMHSVISDGRDPNRIGKGIERAKMFDAEKVTRELVDCYMKAMGQGS